jgi:hypothetical protein
MKRKSRKLAAIPQALMFDLDAAGNWVSKAKAPWKAKREFDGARWMATVLAAADSRLLVEIKPEE